MDSRLYFFDLTPYGKRIAMVETEVSEKKPQQVTFLLNFSPTESK